MSDGIPMPAKPAKVYAVPARPGLVNDMREWELIGTTTWMPDTIAEQIDEALDGYRRAQDAHTQTWSFGTIPAAPWLLLMLGFKVRVNVRSVARTIRYSDGRVQTYPGHPLRPSLRTGYHLVGLSRNSKRDNRFVHHLVLLTFVGERPEGQEALHYNDIRTDNRLSNLSYGTRSDNTRDQVRNGKHNQASKECPTQRKDQ